MHHGILIIAIPAPSLINHSFPSVQSTINLHCNPDTDACKPYSLTVIKSRDEIGESLSFSMHFECATKTKKDVCKLMH